MTDTAGWREAELARVRRPLDEASHAPGWLYSSPDVYRTEIDRLFSALANEGFSRSLML